MAEATSSIEKIRQHIYDSLKQEDIDYVNARSKKVTLDLSHRKKWAEDPWLQCFFFNDTESKKTSGKSSICFDTSKSLRNIQIVDITDHLNISDEEINFCKAAMRREARSKNLTDLSSKSDDLRLLFLRYGEELPENFRKLRNLSGEIAHNMVNFEISLKLGLKALKPLNSIAVTADTTVDDAVANIAKMRCMIQDFQILTDSVRENICKVVENFERYEELDEKMDRDVFSFLANFFPNFLYPRSMRKRKITST